MGLILFSNLVIIIAKLEKSRYNFGQNHEIHYPLRYIHKHLLLTIQPIGTELKLCLYLSSKINQLC